MLFVPRPGTIPNNRNPTHTSDSSTLTTLHPCCNVPLGRACQDGAGVGHGRSVAAASWSYQRGLRHMRGGAAGCVIWCGPCRRQRGDGGDLQLRNPVVLRRHPVLAQAAACALAQSSSIHYAATRAGTAALRSSSAPSTSYAVPLGATAFAHGALRHPATGACASPHACPCSATGTCNGFCSPKAIA